MRILMIVLNQVGKGTYWRAFHFGRILSRRGHCVTLMATSPASRFHLREYMIDGVRIVETPDLLPGSLRSGWDIWNALRRIGWLRKYTFDVVHAFESRPVVLLPALVAKQRGAKLIMDWCDWFGRGGSVEERPNPLLRAIIRPIDTYFEESFRSRADGTTVINAFLHQRAIQLGISPKSILLIRNGSEAKVPCLDSALVRQTLGLSAKSPIIGHVGNIFVRDANLMAAAFNLVQQTIPTAQLLLIGYFTHNMESLLDNPKALIRTGPLSPDKLYQYLSACDLCWLPLSRSGANQGRWPHKLSDYMAVGRPVVSTEVGDLPNVIHRYQLGSVTSPNPADFAAETIALLGDPRRRAQLGQASYEAALKIFSWERLVETLENFYQQVLRLN